MNALLWSIPALVAALWVAAAAAEPRPVGHLVYVPVCAGWFPPSAGVVSQ